MFFSSLRFLEYLVPPVDLFGRGIASYIGHIDLSSLAQAD
jgi:hypothetical protein